MFSHIHFTLFKGKVSDSIQSPPDLSTLCEMVKHQVGTRTLLFPWSLGKQVPCSCLRRSGLGCRRGWGKHPPSPPPHNCCLLRKTVKWLRKDRSLQDNSFSFIYNHISLSHCSYLDSFLFYLKGGECLIMQCVSVDCPFSSWHFETMSLRSYFYEHILFRSLTDFPFFIGK